MMRDEMTCGTCGHSFGSLEEMADEMVERTLVQQRAKLDTYRQLKEQDLPIPNDLKAEIEANGLADA